MRARLARISPPLQSLLILALLVMGCGEVTHQGVRKVVSHEVAREGEHALAPAAKKSIGEAAKRVLESAQSAGERDAGEAARKAARDQLYATLSEEERAQIESETREKYGEIVAGDQNLEARAESDPEYREKLKEKLRDCLIEATFGDQLKEATCQGTGGRLCEDGDKRDCGNFGKETPARARPSRED